jgi:hypothetical protein
MDKFDAYAQLVTHFFGQCPASTPVPNSGPTSDLLAIENTGTQATHEQRKKDTTNIGLLALFGFEPKIKYKYITEN